MNVTDFLIWLVAGGCVVAVSWVFEQMAWFQSLPPTKKRYFQYAISALLGCIALAVQLYVPKEILALIDPYFKVLAGIFGMIFLNQASHTLDPRKIED